MVDTFISKFLFNIIHCDNFPELSNIFDYFNRLWQEVNLWV
jgi:hypothetical protein